MLKVSPLNGIIYLKLEETKAGVLDMSSKLAQVEVAEVLAVGDDVKHIKKGDRLFVKSWGVDLITYKDQRYCFVSLETNAVLAKIA